VSQALVSLLTALADDELILGHRHSEWTGFAPHIEEDVAFSSIAQDEIGHAAAFYSLIAETTNDTADRLALGRESDEYRNAIICERPNGDWAYTLARHWLYDNADAIRLEALQDTKDERLGALVNKIRREERYHLIHADTWMNRVAHGPLEGRTKLAEAVTEAFPEALGLFEPLENEDQIIAEGLMPASSDELSQRFSDRLAGSLDNFGFTGHVVSRSTERAEFVASSSGDLIAGDESTDQEPQDHAALGGRQGRHSDDFKELWAVMTKTYRENPGATW
jgi:ring-1,2-phenylacetyl-CoA epoxidase subunit PaaC